MMQGREGRVKARTIVEATVLLLLLLLPLGSGRLFSDFYTALFLRIMIFGVLMLGFDLLAGYCGLVSFGHAMFFGTGAYVAALTWKYFSDSMWIGMLLGLGINAVIGYVLGLLVVRTRTVYFIFLTFAFSQFFFVTANSWRLIGGTDGLTGIPAPTLLPGISLGERLPLYYFTVTMLLVAYLVARRIVDSPFGRLLRGIHQNEERVKFLGYNSPRLIRRVFLISGLFGSVSGALMACFQPFVPPDYYHLSMSGEFVMMGLLGGMGTLVGPLMGTAIVIFLGDFLSTYLKEAWMLCLGAMYVICILFSPEGLARVISNLSATGLVARVFGRSNNGNT